MALCVASTQVEPLTGLLAESRRDIERVFRDALGEEGALEQVRGDVVGRRLRSATMLGERV